MIAALAALLLLAAAPAAAPANGPAAASTAAERAYFAKNARAAGVTALPGLQVQVMASGPADGAHPKSGEEITVRYKGSLMSGEVFDQTTGDSTTSFILRQVIPGWQVALKLMRPGDKWRIFIPAYMAYGPAVKPEILVDSPLIFEVELVSIAATAPKG